MLPFKNTDHQRPRGSGSRLLAILSTIGAMRLILALAAILWALVILISLSGHIVTPAIMG